MLLTETQPLQIHSSQLDVLRKLKNPPNGDDRFGLLLLLPSLLLLLLLLPHSFRYFGHVLVRTRYLIDFSEALKQVLSKS